jgi:hypothetical protein
MSTHEMRWWRRLRREFHREAFGEELARLDFAPLRQRLRYVHQRQRFCQSPGDHNHPAEYGDWLPDLRKRTKEQL